MTWNRKFWSEAMILFFRKRYMENWKNVWPTDDQKNCFAWKDVHGLHSEIKWSPSHTIPKFTMDISNYGIL